MTPKENKIKVGSLVKHNFRQYPIGKVIKVAEGCNAVYWVDFNDTVSWEVDGKVIKEPRFTICGKFDITFV